MSESDNSKKIPESIALRALRSTGTESQGTAKSSSKGTGVDNIGKDEFLTMLVTQLKNQDPMDPMKSEDFAVNLAQFSSLEQLISIKEALQGGKQGDVASLAGLLGQEVTVNSDTVQVSNNDGGRVRFYLQSQATDVKIELLNIDGSVQETVNVGALEAGRHSISLSNLTTGTGEFQVRVTAQGLSGDASNPQAFAAGIVTGFVPGSDPTLLLGDREVKPDEIVEVNAVS